MSNVCVKKMYVSKYLDTENITVQGINDFLNAEGLRDFVVSKATEGDVFYLLRRNNLVLAFRQNAILVFYEYGGAEAYRARDFYQQFKIIDNNNSLGDKNDQS